MKNAFRKALLDRTISYGAWIQIAHPGVAEIFGRLQFDWVCADLEHGSIDIETLAGLIRAIEAYDAVPLVRLPFADTIWIKRALDAGARGLIIPMVNSGQQAEAAMRQAKYPPRGERGYGYSRANRHGIDFSSYISHANDEIAVVMQVEHRDGIDAIDDILSVDGVDGAFIGPLDLSGSFGKTGQLECPEMVDALRTFRQACARHGKSAGMHIIDPSPANVEAAIADGYTMIALGVDTTLLTAAARGALEAGRLTAAAAYTAD